MFSAPKKILASILLAAGSHASAGVLPVIDVNNPVSWPGAGVDVTHYHYQQHFSAVHDGLLSGFGIFGFPGFGSQFASVKLKIGGGDSWQLDGWAALINPRLDGTPVDLTAYNLHVKAGDEIIFDVGDSVSAFMVQHGLGRLYFKNNNGGVPSWQTDRSLAFTTWVIPDAATPPATVPLPGAGSLMLLGLAMLAVVRRYCKRRAS